MARRDLRELTAGGVDGLGTPIELRRDLLFRESEQVRVRVRVIAERVTLLEYPPDEIRPLFYVLADDEERRLDPVPVQDAQKLRRPALVGAVVVGEGQQLAVAGRPDHGLAESLRRRPKGVVREEEGGSELHFGGGVIGVIGRSSVPGRRM